MIPLQKVANCLFAVESILRLNIRQKTDKVKGKIV